MSDMNKFPSWCDTCVIRTSKDICEWCKIECGTHKPNGYQSDKKFNESYRAMIGDFTQEDVGAQ